MCAFLNWYLMSVSLVPVMPAKKKCPVPGCAASFDSEDPHVECTRHATCAASGSFNVASCQVCAAAMDKILSTPASQWKQFGPYLMIRRRWINFRKLLTKRGQVAQWADPQVPYFLKLSHVGQSPTQSVKNLFGDTASPAMGFTGFSSLEPHQPSTSALQTQVVVPVPLLPAPPKSPSVPSGGDLVLGRDVLVTGGPASGLGAAQDVRGAAPSDQCTLRQ